MSEKIYRLNEGGLLLYVRRYRSIPYREDINGGGLLLYVREGGGLLLYVREGIPTQ